MKKLLSVLLIAAVLVCSLAAVAMADKMILKFASEGAEDQQLNQGGHYWFVDLFNAQSETAEVQEFHNGQLGNVKQCLEQMRFGEPVIIQTDAGWLSDFAPDVDIITGPYFCLEESDYLKICETPWWQEQRDILYEAGYKVLNAQFLYGTRHTIAKKALRAPEDFRGIKLRVPTNEMSIAIIEAMGATATPLAYGEMYTALAQGVVDGVENPLATLYNAKLHEEAKFLSLTGHQTTLTVTVMGASAWEKLSPEDQALLISTGEEAAAYYNANIAKPADQAALEAMLATGVTLIDDVDLEALKAATTKVYDKEMDLYDKVQRQIAAVE